MEVKSIKATVIISLTIQNVYMMEEIAAWKRITWTLNALNDFAIRISVKPGSSDGYCDKNLNTEECEYDGGDCCLPETHFYWYFHIPRLSLSVSRNEQSINIVAI